MNKYIDADLLRKKITEQMDSVPCEVGRGAGTITAKGYGMMEAFQIIRSIIDSLQQEQPDCHTVEDWIQHIKNADQITKDIFSKGPYDVLYDALNHPYQHCYDAIKEFGELCFQTGVNSVKQGQPEVDLEKEMDKFFEGMPIQEHENIFEDTYHMIARHFYELGLNARKEK